MSNEYTGVRVIQTNPEHINSVYKDKSLPVDYLDGRIGRHLAQNEYCVLKYENGEQKQSVITRLVDDKLQLVDPNISVGKLKPRNKEQAMALDALLDPSIRVVVLTGRAGTGKTLLTLAAALECFERSQVQRLLLTRSMSWVGKHGLGALPGDVEEKFGPYLQNYMSNIEVLLGGRYKTIPDLIEQYRMDFIPIQLIRGASWSNACIIADEVQVLGYDEMVALGTRVGEGSKLIIMGDLGQRDENIAREKTGIHKFVNDPRVKASKIVASIELLKCERSDVATLFADVFER